MSTHHLDPAAALPGAGGGIFWNYNDPRTPHGLALELTGSESETPSYFLASFNPVHLEAALWAFVTGMHQQYDASATLLILGGFVAAWRRDWRSTLVLCIACTAGLAFLGRLPERERRRTLSAARVVASGSTARRADTDLQSGRLSALLQGLLIVFLAAGTGLAFERQRVFFRHFPAEGGRWVIDAVRPYVPPGSAIVTGWLDATSLAYGAYVDGSLPGRIIVSDDRLRVPLYARWARARRVFVLVDPHDVVLLPGTIDYATLDPYHELFAVTP